MCVLCPTIGATLGYPVRYLASAIGISVPYTTQGCLLSDGLTGVVIGVTVIALKQLTGFSFCGGVSQSLMSRVSLFLLHIWPIALIEGVVVNYLMARFVDAKFSVKACCSKCE